jgi:hypothetical protein
MNLDRHYILDENHRPVPVDLTVDLMTWGRFFEDIDNRRVALTYTKTHFISTVFLGINHQFGKGPPILFETMSFERTSRRVEEPDGTSRDYFPDAECHRYSSWEDAMNGHKAMVRRYLRIEFEADENMRQLKADMQKVATALNEKFSERQKIHHDE